MTYYELLDTPSTADEQAIKRAWARMVRLHPPDSDPEMNQRLNEAKGILLDSVARADYDAQLHFGEEIEALFEQGHASMQDEDYDEAIRSFKEILALHPKSFAARNLLGLCWHYQENHKEAIRQFERLTSEAPTSALYAANFGHVLKEIDDHKHDAERWFRRAIELESFNAEHHLSLARLYTSQNRFGEAEAAIEDAVAADGQTDVGDIDALMELTVVYLLSGKKQKISQVAERVSSVLPDDEESRSYAASRFLRTAVMLVQDYKNFQDAEYFIRAARKINSDFGNAEAAISELELHAKADREADRMKNDESIEPRVVPTLLAFTVHKRLGFDFPADYGDALIEAAATWSQTDIRIAIRVCEGRYPNACEVIRNLLPRIVEIGVQGYTPRRDNVATSSGGCILPGVLLVVLFVSLFQIARWHGLYALSFFFDTWAIEN